VIGPAWLIFTIIAMFRFQAFPCPRCHKLFFATGIVRWGFAKRCMNRGLPKWAISADADAGVVWKRRFRITRRIAWRMMLCGAVIGIAANFVAGRWRAADWFSLPPIPAAVYVLHPEMDKDAETCLDVGTLRSWRLYAGVALIVAASVIETRY
jgi:hypothetical protein